MFNIAGFKDFYIEVIQKVGIVTEPSEVNFEIYMAIFDGLVGILLNSYAAGVYLKLSRSRNIMLGTSRVVLYVGVLQCFFLISIIPGILAIVGSFMIKKTETEIVDRPRNVEHHSGNDLADRIANLKARKDAGQISQEEYDKKLNDLIEQVAKQNVMNGVEPAKTETLQSKISALKSKNNEDYKKDDV